MRDLANMASITQTQDIIDREWMLDALLEAQRAADLGEVPVGALVVHQEKVVGRGFNQRESLHSAIRHAEISAIEDANQNLKRWRLHDCTLYVTLEPCLMCAGAIVQSRLGRVVFGAQDPKAGAVISLYQTLQDPRLNHRPQVLGGVAASLCGEKLSHFFSQLRKQKAIPKKTALDGRID
jgi:tRNA(adenine34) deaminase